MAVVATSWAVSRSLSEITSRKHSYPKWLQDLFQDQRAPQGHFNMYTIRLSPSHELNIKRDAINILFQVENELPLSFCETF